MCRTPSISNVAATIGIALLCVVSSKSNVGAFTATRMSIPSLSSQVFTRRNASNSYLDKSTRKNNWQRFVSTSSTALRSSTSASSTSASSSTSSSKNVPKDTYDVCIIGSGIGGLSAAAMLSLYGYSVAVFESHTQAGGCAHGYTVRHKGSIDTNNNNNNDNEKIGSQYYKFDTGPSFFSGLNPNLPSKLSNPLRMVLDAIDEQVECIPYKTFGLKFPEGDFIHTTKFGSESMNNIITDDGVKQWKTLMNNMKPLEYAVDALPTIALRGDIGLAITTAPFLPKFMKSNPLENLKLTKPFSSIIDQSNVTNEFIKQWLDLLCFCLSGLPANGTITAEMAMMMGEFYSPDAIMDCPKGGAKSIIDALVRGIEKNGGSIFTNSHVEQINIDNGRATGITLRKNQRQVQAKKAVISNMSIWDLFKSGIVDNNEFPTDFVKERIETPLGKSFMHLHVGFKATREELEKLEAHYMYIDDWSRGVEAEDNAVLLSIPSVHDDTLAPLGHAVLHIYTPATESYDRWDGVDRKSEEYKNLKEERSQYLWTVLEKVIPDIRDRSTVVQVGTPLTHERFLRRFKGSYGPAIKAGEGSFPFPGTPVKNLLLCGDSCFPGIGVPAVAGSGLLAANSVSFDSLKPQLEVLERLKQRVNN